MPDFINDKIFLPFYCKFAESFTTRGINDLQVYSQSDHIYLNKK